MIVAIVFLCGITQIMGRPNNASDLNTTDNLERIPSWPQFNNTYLLPKKLNVDDIINITAEITNTPMLNISLIAESSVSLNSSKVLCMLVADTLTGRLMILHNNKIWDDIDEDAPETIFNVWFRRRSNPMTQSNNALEISSNTFHKVIDFHEEIDIRFLKFAGENVKVTELEFKNIKEQTDNEVVYGAQLNGDNQRSPPWPQPQNENEIMFILPRKLNSGDRVTINGTLRSNPRTMSVNLITGNTTPDYQNIAFSFEATFPNGGEDKILIRLIQNGVQEVISGDYQESGASETFTGSNFTFGVTLRVATTEYGDVPIIDVYVDGSFVHQIQLKHNLENIKFLTINGDVERVTALDFQFS